jgi:molybdopterin-guanine dinucleotide biosynthesis protein A
MLGWQCRTLLACTEVVVAVGRDQEQSLPPMPGAVDTTIDELPGEGPLAAIIAGLRRLRDHHGFSDRDAAMTVGCDQPFLTPATVRWLCTRIGDADVLMPEAHDKLQPLTAIYRISCLPAAERLLASGARRPREIATATASCRIVREDELRSHDPELRFLRNLNNPDDYAEARRQIDSEQH